MREYSKLTFSGLLTLKGRKNEKPDNVRRTCQRLKMISVLALFLFIGTSCTQKQEHRTFIDWFIAVPAKITSSGHQIELKMYEHHFYKSDWEELDRLIEAA